MTNITINKIELASELAEIKLLSNFLGEIMIYENEGEDEESTRYTEKAQDIFNEYYDYYLGLIESCKA